MEYWGFSVAVAWEWGPPSSGSLAAVVAESIDASAVVVAVAAVVVAAVAAVDAAVAAVVVVAVVGFLIAAQPAVLPEPAGSKTSEGSGSC